MSNLSRICVAVAGLFAFAAPAAAQTFEAEIDCGGVFQQGDDVPFTVRFEEQAFQQHNIQLVVTLTGPGISKTVINKSFTLGANQDRDINKIIALKANAPTGDYDMRVEADDGTTLQSDTCSFDVI